MNTWRDIILKEFIPQVNRKTLVADPDGLISEEFIIQEIQSRGFELVPYEEPITFRYLYESRYRPGWENGGTAELVIFFRGEPGEFTRLPFDILNGARRIRVGLDRLFPDLNRGVLQTLDREFLDALYQAQRIYPPQNLSENATKDFILRHVFEIAPELIKTPTDILRVLLRKHYREQKIPAGLDQYLIQMLRQSGRFPDWPLEVIVVDRSGFWAFLQERWPTYLRSVISDAESMAKEFAVPYHLAFQGPALLPFEHNDVRVYMDNLFAEGWLKPVTAADLNFHESFTERSLQALPNWVRMGVRSDPEMERQSRLQKLMQVVEENLTADMSRHSDWVAVALKWAEVNALWYGLKKPLKKYSPLQSTYEQLRQKIDERFLVWMPQRFGSLHNLITSDPVMVHQIPRFMAKVLKVPDTKTALIILDGMSIDQWVAIRRILQKQIPDYQFLTTGTFAWVPTMTSVSRQAIFAGKPPMFFPERIWNTQAEPRLWTQFWTEAGFTENEIRYVHMAGETTKDFELIAEPKTRVIGIVVNKIDKIMHGMELGSAGMINQVSQWAENGDLARLIRSLIADNFQIFISSDHGNIEASGCGHPAEGAAADLRGERVRVYPDEDLRSGVKIIFPEALEWKPVGLPAGFFPLLAPDRTAFVQKGKHTVTHGGIAIEEVIVPFIRIEKR